MQEPDAILSLCPVLSCEVRPVLAGFFSKGVKKYDFCPYSVSSALVSVGMTGWVGTASSVFSAGQQPAVRHGNRCRYRAGHRHGSSPRQSRAACTGQQSALGAVTALHHACGGGECLIGQVCLCLLHQCLPRHNTGAGLGLLLGQSLGHIVRCIVAPPHSGDIVGCAAHEPQILFVAGSTGLTKGSMPLELG